MNLTVIGKFYAYLACAYNVLGLMQELKENNDFDSFETVNEAGTIRYKNKADEAVMEQYEKYQKSIKAVQDALESPEFSEDALGDLVSLADFVFMA